MAHGFKLVSFQLLIAMLSSLAHAQASPSVDATTLSSEGPVTLGAIKGRLRIGLDMMPLIIERLTTSLERGGESKLSFTAVGVSGMTALGPVASYGVSRELLLTARVVLGRSETETAIADTVETRALVTPMLEYVWAQGHSVRPYIGGMLGVGVVALDQANTSTVDVRILPGVAFGAHMFIGPQLSLDPSLTLALEAGAGSVDYGDGSSQSTTLLGGAVFVSLGLSYWTAASVAAD